MLTDAERERLYGGADKVAEVDRHIAETVAAWPPLTSRQRDRLRALLHTTPAETAIPRQRRRSEPKGARAA